MPELIDADVQRVEHRQHRGRGRSFVVGSPPPRPPHHAPAPVHCARPLPASAGVARSAGLAVCHGSSAGAWALLRAARVILLTRAVANRNDGPTSSTSTPYADRFSPSSVSHRDSRSRPTTTTRVPLRSDSAACSAGSRHTVQVRNSGSPSRYSPDSRSRHRGVEATVNLATAPPAPVYRRSGSSVRFPTTVTVVSFAITLTPSELRAVRPSGGHRTHPSHGAGWDRNPSAGTRPRDAQRRHLLRHIDQIKATRHR